MLLGPLASLGRRDRPRPSRPPRLDLDSLSNPSSSSSSNPLSALATQRLHPPHLGLSLPLLPSHRQHSLQHRRALDLEPRRLLARLVLGPLLPRSPLPQPPSASPAPAPSPLPLADSLVSSKPRQRPPVLEGLELRFLSNSHSSSNSSNSPLQEDLEEAVLTLGHQLAPPPSQPLVVEPFPHLPLGLGHQGSLELEPEHFPPSRRCPLLCCRPRSRPTHTEFQDL